MKIARRSFSMILPAAAACNLFGQTPPPTAPAHIESTLVNDWIIKAHQRKLDAMKELLARQPSLIHSSWDWGNGDFESALQAAAHTGSREMALFLLDQGARLDLFATTMLGQATLLRNAVETFPASINVRGAHGITLLSHAVQGRDQARSTLDYLLGKGIDINESSTAGTTALMMSAQTAQRDTVNFLLAKGANPNMKAKDGSTALSISLKAGHQDIASDLKAAGAVGYPAG